MVLQTRHGNAMQTTVELDASNGLPLKKIGKIVLFSLAGPCAIVKACHTCRVSEAKTGFGERRPALGAGPEGLRGGQGSQSAGTLALAGRTLPRPVQK